MIRSTRKDAGDLSAAVRISVCFVSEMDTEFSRLGSAISLTSTSLASTSFANTSATSNLCLGPFCLLVLVRFVHFHGAVVRLLYRVLGLLYKLVVLARDRLMATDGDLAF